MDDDLDVDGLLEAPYAKKADDRMSSSPSPEKKKKHKKDKRRSSSREKIAKHSSRGYSRDRSPSPKHKDRHPDYEDYKMYKRRSRSRSPRRPPRYPPPGRNFYPHRRDYHRNSYGNRRGYPSRRMPMGRDYGRYKSRSRSPDRRMSFRPRKYSASPKRTEKRDDSSDENEKPARLHKNPDLTPEERDMRTVFCMQLSQRVRARDLEEFFSPVGKVQDVRIILDNKTRRSKGIAYVEFQDTFSVSLALGLSGKKLHGVPIVVQLTQAEKNRVAASAMITHRGMVGPMNLYVGSLHFNVTEEMLRGIFEPFGTIDKLELVKDSDSGKSKGYGFVLFHDSESAKKALEQLNGLELAGKPMKVTVMADRAEFGPSSLDSEDMDRAGIDLGATGRLQLMAKLAEGTGLELPQAAVKALEMTNQAQASPVGSKPNVSVATQCFILSNMFDPTKESGPNWDEEIKNDVVEECRNHGGALHVYVDKNSTDGNVYVKCPNLTSAAASVKSLHGRYFAGRVIVAAYVPLANYHMLFPDSAAAVKVL